ncbi:MAG TPA: GNAT family N-acetyltransferase [Acidimicrobiia bacterium]|nr:GNAT family N-acetyltransferase [Acidimicrobiia bacterium]
MSSSESFGEVLPWDSDFFGVKVARINAADPREITAADQWCRAQRVDVAYLLLPVEEPAVLRHAEALAFGFVDIRIELAVARERFSPPAERDTGAITIRHHNPADIPALEEIAASAHRDSRFYADGRFATERCDALYATWIRRDSTEDGRHVLIAEHGGDVAGYLSYHFTGEGAAASAVIDLVGVNAEHRGVGIGRALVEAGVDAGLRGAARVEVVTQGRNRAAQRLYQGAGMTTSAVGIWFHKWYA